MSANHRHPRRFLLSATAGVVAVVAAIGAFLPAYLAFATDEGARQLLSSRDGGDVALDIALPLDPTDPTGQDAAVRSVIQTEFGGSGAGMVSSVHRSIITGGIGAPIGDVVVASVPGLQSGAAVVSGALPPGAGDLVVDADSAAAHGIDVGETLIVGDVPLRVSGTWHLNDRRAGQWFALPQLASAPDDQTPVRVVADEETLGLVAAGAGVDVTAHWTIVPDPAQVTARALDGAVSAWRAMPAALRSGGVEVDGFAAAGGLLPTALEARGQTAAMATAAPLSLSTFGIIAVVALIEIARLIGAMRAPELSLLWSRGAQRRRLVGDAAREAAPSVVVGAVIGAIVGAAAMSAVGGAALLGVGWTWVVFAPLVSAGAAAVIVIARASGDARALDAPARRGDPRLAVTARAVVVVAVVLAASLSGWQLVLYGSARSDEGTRASVDPLAVLAPALCLIGIVLLLATGLLLLRPALERFARRRTDALVSLVVRGVVRRRGFALTPIVLCALALGQLVIAAGYTGTWQTAADAASARDQGTALRVTGPIGSLTPDVLAGIATTPGVGRVAPVGVQSISVASESAALVSLTAPALAALGDPGIPDLTDAVAGMTPPEIGGIAVPAVDAIDVTLAWMGGPRDATVSLLFVDEWGNTVVSAPAVTRFDGGSGTARVTVPASDAAATGTWTVEAIDVAGVTENSSTIEVTGIDAAGAEILSGPWEGGDLGDYPLPLQHAATGGALIVPPGVPGVRLVSVPPSGAAPMVVSALFAERTGVVVGDVVPLLLDSVSGSTTFRVAAIVQAVPGAGAPLAVLVDLRATLPFRLITQSEPPVPDQAWLEITGEADEVAAAVQQGLPGDVVVDGSAIAHASTAADASAIALWVGALGTAVLAVGAVAGLAGAQAWSRRDESDALRMIGMTARRRVAARLGEFAIACGAGALIGAISGIAVTVLLVPAIARGAVPGTDLGPIAPVVDPLWLAVSVGGFVVVLTGALLFASARAERTARRAGER